VRHGTEMGYSIGLRLSEDGAVTDVIEGMAAARAGIGRGMKSVAVNGKAYSPAVLRDVVRATTDPRQRQIELLIDNEGDVRAFQVTYSEGEKYPLLERDKAKPDMLSKIIAPLTWSQ